MVGSEGLVEQGLELPAVDRVHLLVRMLVEFAQPLYGFVGDGCRQQTGNTAEGGFRHGRAYSEDKDHRPPIARLEELSERVFGALVAAVRIVGGSRIREFRKRQNAHHADCLSLRERCCQHLEDPGSHVGVA